MINFPYIQFDVSDFEGKFYKPFNEVKTILAELHTEVEENYDLIPATPLFEVIRRAIEAELEIHLAKIRALPVSSQTLARRRRGGMVPVTRDGASKKIIEDSVETAVRTGHMMGILVPPLTKKGGEEFGWEIRRGKNFSDFMVLLDAEQFYDSYPSKFSEWLYRKAGMHLMDLDPESETRILGRVTGLLMARVERILRGNS